MKRNEAILGLLLVSPAVLLVLLLIVYPIFYNLVLSFYKVSLNPNKPDLFIGLQNYAGLFADPKFYYSLGITVVYTALTVVGSTAVGLLAALLMNRQFVGRGVARSLIILSYVAPIIATVFVWQYMFNTIYGVVNYLLVDRLHWLTATPAWFDNPVFSMILVVAYDIWRVFPYAFMMLLAALQAIDRSLYEAAEVDGASPWDKFRYITLPEILPSIATIMTLRMIWNFYKFDDVFLLTKQIPIMGVYIYDTAFSVHNNGMASAITVVLFVIVFSCVLLFGRKVLKRR